MKELFLVLLVLCFGFGCDADGDNDSSNPKKTAEDYLPSLDTECLTGTWTLYQGASGNNSLITEKQWTFNSNFSYNSVTIGHLYNDLAQTDLDVSIIDVNEGEWFIENGLLAYGDLTEWGDLDNANEFEFADADSITNLFPPLEIYRVLKTAACFDNQLALSNVYLPRKKGQPPELNGEWVSAHNSYTLIDGEFVLTLKTVKTYNLDSKAKTMTQTETITTYCNGTLSVKPRTHSRADCTLLPSPEVIVDITRYRIWQVNDANSIRIASCDNANFTGCNDLAAVTSETNYTFIQGHLVMGPEDHVYTKEE